MPRMLTTELAGETRRRWPYVKILVVARYADSENIAPDLPANPSAGTRSMTLPCETVKHRACASF